MKETRQSAKRCIVGALSVHKETQKAAGSTGREAGKGRTAGGAKVGGERQNVARGAPHPPTPTPAPTAHPAPSMQQLWQPGAILGLRWAGKMGPQLQGCSQRNLLLCGEVSVNPFPSFLAQNFAF